MHASTLLRLRVHKVLLVGMLDLPGCSDARPSATLRQRGKGTVLEKPTRGEGDEMDGWGRAAGYL